MSKLTEFKKNLKYFIEDSCCEIRINLLSWGRRFDYGWDKNDDRIEVVWLFIEFGPIDIKLAVSHWDQW